MVGQLTTVSYHAQYIQRQILRAGGLSNLQRDTLLSTLATMSSSVQALCDQAQAWLDENET